MPRASAPLRGLPLSLFSAGVRATEHPHAQVNRKYGTSHVAERFWTELQERLVEFGLELHAGKTRFSFFQDFENDVVEMICLTPGSRCAAAALGSAGLA